MGLGWASYGYGGWWMVVVLNKCILETTDYD